MSESKPTEREVAHNLVDAVLKPSTPDEAERKQAVECILADIDQSTDLFEHEDPDLDPNDFELLVVDSIIHMYARAMGYCS